MPSEISFGFFNHYPLSCRSLDFDLALKAQQTSHDDQGALEDYEERRHVSQAHGAGRQQSAWYQHHQAYGGHKARNATSVVSLDREVTPLFLGSLCSQYFALLLTFVYQPPADFFE